MLLYSRSMNVLLVVFAARQTMAVWFSCVLLLIISSNASAFTLGPTSWSEGRATFFVNFAESNPSSDADKFQAAFIEAMNAWNDRSTFIFDLDTSEAEDPCGAAGSDPRNGVSFTEDVCGSAFGASTLAVTRTSFNSRGTTRTGIVFRDTVNWDVFTGSMSGRTDFRRVAVHELGHALGLNHAGNDAIMRPSISAIEVPQADDINGVAAFYDLDSDGTGFAEDNCRLISNPTQADFNQDGEGDACDNDIDGDGVFNSAARDQDFGVDTLSGFLLNLGLNSRARAQTFTTGVSGILESVAVPVSCTGSAGFTASITTLSGDNPSTTVLGTKSISDASMAALTSEGFVLLDVEELSISVEVGSRYALVVDSSSACQWSLASPSNYAGGTARSSSTDRSSWFALSFGQGSEDLPFIVNVIPSSLDNCPLTPNANQADSNNDGVGNACDDASDDADGDGIPNSEDNCPVDSNPNQSNFDGDLFGDACDVDIDNDGVLNAVDGDDMNSSTCSDLDNDLCEDCSSGEFNLNSDGVDTDADGICNLGDVDDDGDGFDDSTDNCPLRANADQLDTNNDGVGDVCESLDMSEDAFCIPVRADNGRTALICL